MISNITNKCIVALLSLLLSCDQQLNNSFLCSAGSEGFDECYGLAIDSKNNIIISGVFSKSISFTGSDTNVELVSRGALDFFVAKYSSKGKFMWAKRFGGEGMDEVSAMSLDEEDRIYVTGYYQASPDFLKYETTVASKSFLMKLTTDGNQVWAVKLGGNNVSEGTGVSAKSGCLYWTSFYNGSLKDSSTSIGLNDIVCTKLSKDGQVVLEKSIGFKGNDQSKEIYISPNNSVFITGFLSNQVHGNSSAALMELDTNLTMKAQTILYDAVASEAISVIEDGNRHKYISGSFRHTDASQDAFVCKLSEHNQVMWNNTFCSSGNEWAKALAFDTSGNILSAVVLNHKAKVSGLKETVTGFGHYDVFISKLSPDGNILQHASYGDDEEEGINKIIIDKGNNILFCGWFYKTLTIHQKSITSKGEGDVFFGRENLTQLFK